MSATGANRFFPSLTNGGGGGGSGTTTPVLSAVTVSIGAGGDYGTLSSAVTNLKYQGIGAGTNVTLLVLSGTTVSEQLSFVDVNFGAFTIGADGDSNTIAVDSTGWVADPTAALFGYTIKPLISAIRSTCPNISAIFASNGAETDDGFAFLFQSSIKGKNLAGGAVGFNGFDHQIIAAQDSTASVVPFTSDGGTVAAIFGASVTYTLSGTVGVFSGENAGGQVVADNSGNIKLLGGGAAWEFHTSGISASAAMIADNGGCLTAYGEGTHYGPQGAYSSGEGATLVTGINISGTSGGALFSVAGGGSITNSGSFNAADWSSIAAQPMNQPTRTGMIYCDAGDITGYQSESPANGATITIEPWAQQLQINPSPADIGALTIDGSTFSTAHGAQVTIVINGTVTALSVTGINGAAPVSLANYDTITLEYIPGAGLVVI